MKNQDWWNRSESFSAFQGVEPSKVETEKMKAISFGLKELWQEKKTFIELENPVVSYLRS